MTPIQSLLAYHLVPTETCLEFDRPDKQGYGVIHCSAGSFKAHRIAYEWWVGPIPEGLTIDHLCRNRACCWPPHLEAVTFEENVRRGVSFSAENGRKINCPTCGSDYIVRHVSTRGRDQRECMDCARRHKREHMRRVYAHNLAMGLTSSGKERQRARRR